MPEAGRPAVKAMARPGRADTTAAGPGGPSKGARDVPVGEVPRAGSEEPGAGADSISATPPSGPDEQKPQGAPTRSPGAQGGIGGLRQTPPERAGAETPIPSFH